MVQLRYSYEEHLQGFFADSDLFTILLSKSLLVIQRGLCHLHKSQLKLEGKGGDGWLSGVSEKTCHPDITQNLNLKARSSGFSLVPLHTLLSQVKAGKTFPSG